MSQVMGVEDKEYGPVERAEEILAQYGVLATDRRSQLHCVLFDLLADAEQAGMDFEGAVDLARSEWEAGSRRVRPIAAVDASQGVAIDGTEDEPIERAEKVLARYAAPGTDRRARLQCVLFDLFGYAERAGMDFGDAVGLARSDWEAEFGGGRPVAPGDETACRLAVAEGLLRRLAEWAERRGWGEAPIWGEVEELLAKRP